MKVFVKPDIVNSEFCDEHRLELEKHGITALCYYVLEHELNGVNWKLYHPKKCKPILTKVVCFNGEMPAYIVLFVTVARKSSPKKVRGKGSRYPKRSGGKRKRYKKEIYDLCDRLGEIYASALFDLFLEIQSGS